MMKFVKTLAAATLIAGSAVSASALAQENSREFSFTVERASLDSERGVRVAYQRLNAEAQRYCEALPFSIITTRGACQSDVVNHVVASLNNEAPTTLHDERTRQARFVADRG